MKVTLREKKRKNDISLYLDIYHSGKRQYKYLKLFLHKNPKTAIQKEHNKTTSQLARNIEAKYQLDMQSSQYGFLNEDLLNSSFTSYFHKVAEEHRNCEGTYANWISAAKHFNKFSKGEVIFSDVDLQYVKRFRKYLEKDALSKNKNKLSINTASSYFNKFRAALNQAVKDEIIKESPARNVSGIKEEIPHKEFLTEEEIIKIKEVSCDIPILKRAFLFSCYSGLRFSDVKKLLWSEIQHSNDQYYIRFRQKKTNMPETLPIPEEALNYLGQEASGKELVFTGLNYSASNNDKLRSWIEKAGISKHITFHCARHTYATLLITKGVDIYIVSKLCGHSSVKSTEVYAKLIDLKRFDAVNKLNLSFEK